MKQGTILRIEKISPHDGTGLRTVVFFKGCPLRCAWCSTPESHSMRPELFYKEAKCLHCGRCIQMCHQGALAFSVSGGAVVRDTTRCVQCLHCASVCQTHAIGVYGKAMTVDEVMQEIRKERLFYYFSGGGVTLSGGDLLCQADFARELLKACRDECISTSAELDMYGPYENVRKVLEYLDSYYVDIKLMDGEQHKRWTGVDNASILSNILRASSEYGQKTMRIRVPLIRGVNDTADNIRETIEFCKRLTNCKTLEFLPYHRLGVATYRYIGKEYTLGDMPSMTFEEAEQYMRYIDPKALPFRVLISGKPLVGMQS